MLQESSEFKYGWYHIFVWVSPGSQVGITSLPFANEWCIMGDFLCCLARRVWGVVVNGTHLPLTCSSTHNLRPFVTAAAWARCQSGGVYPAHGALCATGQGLACVAFLTSVARLGIGAAATPLSRRAVWLRSTASPTHSPALTLPVDWQIPSRAGSTFTPCGKNYHECNGLRGLMWPFLVQMVVQITPILPRYWAWNLSIFTLCMVPAGACMVPACAVF